MDSPRILILVRRKADRGALEDWLSGDYSLVAPDEQEPLNTPFDLAIIDGASLKASHSQVRARRKRDEPVLLPLLLLTQRRKGGHPTRHLGLLVDDLIVRPVNEDELRARVANLLRMRRLSLELKKEHDRVLKLSATDDVSGFNNTRYLHRYLDRVLGTPQPAQELSLIFLDIDNFKRVVDRHGHLLGSKVLKEVAQAMHKQLEPDDRIVRYGGDEFVVILPRQDHVQAIEKVHRLKEAVTTTAFLQKEGLDVHVTASFGLATYPHDAHDKRELLARADQCLFRSKTAGKNRISVAGESGSPQRSEPALA